MVRLDQITIAVGDQPRMVAFYSQVFQAPFATIDCGSFQLHHGEVAPGLQLQLCPKAIAGIEATQNIHQLRFVVDEVERYLALAVIAGGTIIEEVRTEGARQIGSVRDPDGNSIEFISAL